VKKRATVLLFLALRGCWCDEERAPYSTKAERVRPLTEAQTSVCARSWCDEERAPYSTKAERVRPLTEARSARRVRVRVTFYYITPTISPPPHSS